ncbi:MAG: cysteine desulfurase family protein [Pirellulales bacterium]
MKPIYLDFNSTTPLAPSVQEAMLPFMAEHFSLPTGNYSLARVVEESLEDSRGQVAKLIGAIPDEIVFTASGTESCNLAIKGVMLRDFSAGPKHVVISSFEHPAVSQSAKYLERFGCDVTVVPCDSHGIVHPEDVENAIREETRLVSIMLANHEIGTVQPIRKIAELCRSEKVAIHADATQCIGKNRVQVGDLDVDLLSLSAHKFYGPKGAGALYVRTGIDLEPFVHGAGNERGLRAGTENVAAWIGMGKAANLSMRCIDEAADRQAKLRDRLQQGLFDAITEPLTVHGAKAERLSNTLSINFPNVSAAQLLKKCPEICAATSSSDQTGSGNFSKTLRSLGIREKESDGTIRLSVGWYTSEEEIDKAVSILVHAWESLVS